MFFLSNTESANSAYHATQFFLLPVAQTNTYSQVGDVSRESPRNITPYYFLVEDLKREANDFVAFATKVIVFFVPLIDTNKKIKHKTIILYNRNSIYLQQIIRKKWM